MPEVGKATFVLKKQLAFPGDRHSHCLFRRQQSGIAVAIRMIAAVAATGGKQMEIKKPTLPAIETKIFEESETLMSGIGSANTTKASEIASRINNRNALQKKLGDVLAYARNNDASGINELLDGNQTLGTERKTPLHPPQVFQDNFETTKSPDTRHLSSTNEGSPKVDPTTVSLLEQNLLAARSAGPMIKRLTNDREDK